MIENLRDFTNYRKFCPFCNSRMKLKGTIGSSPTSSVRVQKDKDKYLIYYDQNNNFSQFINRHIDHIALDAIDNTIEYHKVKEDDFFYHGYDGQTLTGNRLHLTLACGENCTNFYFVKIEPIMMDKFSKTSFKPVMFMERFVINNEVDNKFVVFENYPKEDWTSIKMYSIIDGTMVLENDINVPLVNFDFNDRNQIKRKVKLLLTFA